uniref:COX assembly mitochondrial protein n=1 Tax=Cyanistes caeruleus TaxID=156563 RepID=A0A8C0UGA9_CYACU
MREVSAFHSGVPEMLCSAGGSSVCTLYFKIKLLFYAESALEKTGQENEYPFLKIPEFLGFSAPVFCSAFTKCCQETGVLMVVKCRQENTALKDCLVGYYSDPSFYEECKAEYLKQREEYRATGIKKKRQKFTQNV